MIAPPNIKTPAQYLASLEEPRRSDVRAIHNAIRKAVPKLKPGMIGGSLGYGKYRYQYAGGREGDAGAVLLASQRQYISLYLGCSREGGYLAEKSTARLGKVFVGKCRIRFRKLSDLDLKLAMELVKLAAKQHQESGKRAV